MIETGDFGTQGQRFKKFKIEVQQTENFEFQNKSQFGRDKCRVKLLQNKPVFNIDLPSEYYIIFFNNH